MRMKSKFDEVKIKMVMKLRRLTREEAIRELKLFKKAASKTKPATDSDKARTPVSVGARRRVRMDKDCGLMSAEEFFSRA